MNFKKILINSSSIIIAHNVLNVIAKENQLLTGLLPRIGIYVAVLFITNMIQERMVSKNE